MKKILILTMLLGALGLTGCGNKEAKATEVETETYTTVLCDQVEETTESLTEDYAEWYLELMKDELIADLEEQQIEYGMDENLIDELIELVSAIEYDPSYIDGFDTEALEINVVNLYVKYNVLPAKYEGCTLSDIDSNDIMIGM